MLKTLLAFAVLSVALPAFAYLDPGTGSILLQSLIGIVAFAAAAVGTCFGRIRAFLFHRKKKSGAAGDGVERFGESHEK